MSKDENSQSDHGHRATRPAEVPGRGWREIAGRVWGQLGRDHVQVVAAGVAFYFFLALFPALAAVVSIYGLITDPADVERQMGQLTAVLPAQAHELLSTILNRIAEKSEQTLGWSLLLGLLLSLWSAKKGVNAVFEGVNIAYNELDKRSFIRKNALTLLFTLGGIVVLIFCMALVVGFPALVGTLNLPPALQTALSWLRWPLLAVIIVFGLSLVYKFAPHRSNPRFQWVNWGAIVSTLLWLLGSVLFSFYVNNFGNFDKTYGSFAALIILMLWFFLTAFIILLGAEINSEAEHQTCRDTTVGEEKPMGQRGAYYADHVAGEKGREQDAFG